VSNLGRPSLALLALALFGCHRRAGGDHVTPAPSASASVRLATSAAPAASSASPAAPTASALPLEPATPPPLPETFVGARSEKACKAQTVELANYLLRGDVSLGGHAGGVAAAWRIHLTGKTQEQVAFASFDPEGRPVARPRGVGQTTKDVPPRVFASGPQWTVVWFDDKSLAFVRPHAEAGPMPDVAHLSAIGPEVAADIALATSPAGAVLATTPFGADKAQLGLFLFAPANDAATVRALGVTHHGKQPHRSAVAAGAGGIFVVWDEGGALVGSRFDAAGKENDAMCTIAPGLDGPSPKAAAPPGPNAVASTEGHPPAGAQRERLALAATSTGAVAMWMEGGRVRTRALDASGCPASPIWTVAEGRWASITSLGDTALVVWAAADGRLLAARLQPSGAPPARGLDAAEGSSGIKDPPVAIAVGPGKVAFGWSEVMSPVISTKRIVMRIVDAACVP